MLRSRPPCPLDSRAEGAARKEQGAVASWADRLESGRRSPRRRNTALGLSVVGVCLLIAAGATGISVLTGRAARPLSGPSTAAACTAPQASLASAAPGRLGSWPITLVEPG